jgi:hypothetical protein
MNRMGMTFLIFGFPTLLLALPSLSRRSLKSFLAALFLSFFGIVFPLFVFVMSYFLIPEWKGDAHDGWLNCFFAGKLALTPLVLWAMAAFFAVEIYKPDDCTRPWIVLGYFFGGLVSSVSTMIGIYCSRHESEWPFSVWLFFPVCVSAWYSVRAVLLMKQARIDLKTYAAAIAGSLPFWIGSIWWSRKIYAALPDTQPGCFVVTAATRGHGRLVGPFVEITRGGGKKTANHQLLTFWQFEDAWRRRAPAVHSLFRRIYNRVGPLVARRVRRAWMADAIYLALKPAEFIAALLMRLEWVIFKHEHAREAGGSAGTVNANSGGKP